MMLRENWTMVLVFMVMLSMVDHAEGDIDMCPSVILPEVTEDDHAPCDCSQIYTKCMSELQCQGGMLPSGVYTIYPGSPPLPVQVYCDMNNDGGGWTVFQNRFNGQENFRRTWIEYENGFGSPHGEYWLGLQNMYQVASVCHGDESELAVSVTGDPDSDGVVETRTGIWPVFRLSGRSDNYTLTVNGYDRDLYDLGNSMAMSSGEQFSAYDVDNDPRDTEHCGMTRNAGWWFAHCGRAYLNGVYRNGTYTGPDQMGMDWCEWDNRANAANHYSFLRSVMKIRPTSW